MPKRRYWLLKSEPEVFSFEDLLAAKGRRTFWDGVRNYTARNTLRDDMKLGDGVLFYHSNTKPPGIAGVAKVVREGYPDPTQFDAKDPHYDPKARQDDPRWMMVDIEAVLPLERYVALDELRAAPGLRDMALVQRGQRLSVQPVSAGEWRAVLKMGGLSTRDVG
jgi:predicted RNA-binding protein with PUA-like domain